jgi:hypothetical protein
MTIDDILREELATSPSDLPEYSPLARDNPAQFSTQSRLAPYNFPPGVSGNPGGVRKRPLSLQELSLQLPEERLRKAVDAVARKAEGGDLRAFAELRDTRDGKPATRVIVTAGDGDSPLVNALQRIAQRIAEAEGAVIEGEARVIAEPQSAVEE